MPASFCSSGNDGEHVSAVIVSRVAGIAEGEKKTGYLTPMQMEQQPEEIPRLAPKYGSSKQRNR